MLQNNDRNIVFFERAVKGETFKKIADDYHMSTSRVGYLVDRMQKTICYVVGVEYQMLKLDQLRKERDKWLDLAYIAKTNEFKKINN